MEHRALSVQPHTWPGYSQDSGPLGNVGSERSDRGDGRSPHKAVRFPTSDSSSSKGMNWSGCAQGVVYPEEAVRRAFVEAETMNLACMRPGSRTDLNLGLARLVPTVGKGRGSAPHTRRGIRI
jgi:hypothetical protein